MLYSTSLGSVVTQYTKLDPWDLSIPVDIKNRNIHAEKGVALQLNKLEFPSPKDTLWHVWLNWHDSGDEDENIKSLQMDRQTVFLGFGTMKTFCAFGLTLCVISVCTISSAFNITKCDSSLNIGVSECKEESTAVPPDNFLSNATKRKSIDDSLDQVGILKKPASNGIIISIVLVVVSLFIALTFLILQWRNRKNKGLLLNDSFV
ncbi:uncharacterized protein LOC111101686 [Crassostrea virginica]